MVGRSIDGHSFGWFFFLVQADLRVAAVARTHNKLAKFICSEADDVCVFCTLTNLMAVVMSGDVNVV